MELDIIRKVKRVRKLRSTEYKDMYAYDDIKEMKWEGIPALKSKTWGVMFTDPIGHDMIGQANNIFDTHNPKWDVLPRGPNDSENAQDYEDWLTWHMNKANEYGEKRPFGEMFNDCNTYNRITAQLEFIDNDDEFRYCPYYIKRHDPKTVWFAMGRKSPLWVAVVNNVSGQSIIENWTQFAKDEKVAAAIGKIEKEYEGEQQPRFVYFDYTDKEKRYVYCYRVGDESIDESLGEKRDVIEIVNERNELGFLNWAISTGTSDPLLYTLHKGDLWLNINRSESIKRSTAYMRAIYPLYKVMGAGGDVEIDFSGEFPAVIVPPGRTLEEMQAPPLDPTFNELSAQDRALASRSVGLENVSGIEASNVQFATITALIQLRLAQLESSKNTFERAGDQLAHIMFKWLWKKNKSVVGYRASSRNKTAMRGDEIAMGPGDVSQMENLFASCKLLPNNPTDKLQRMNMISQMKQVKFPVPDEELLEGLGFGHPGDLMRRYEEQEISYVALEAFKTKILGMAQLEIQNAQLQQQAQAQQGVAPPEGNQSQPAFDATQGQGFNASQGGTPPMAQGGMNRGALEV